MSDNRRRRKQEIETSRWLITYSDMVTLLLTFFVLLYSMSAIDISRFQKIMNSIQLSFLGYTGVLERTAELEDIEEVDLRPGDLEESVTAEELIMLEKLRQGEEIMEKVQEFLREAALEAGAEVRIEERGVVMELPDKIFFEIGQADLKPEALMVLEKLADLFRGLDNRVIVEGHTCDLPIRTDRFPSNWELSVGRSVAVTRYLVDRQGLSPERFIATGYGEYQPLVPNDSPTNRAKNRRVTVVISVF
ncbi:MAG: OmpA family protein [Firmicutes bacterium]|jgi:chemotaxis protein MotB|nr:OmpA family protein [Bacillota bacterium]